MKKGLITLLLTPVVLILILFCGISPAEPTGSKSDGGLYAVDLQIIPSQPVVGKNTVILTIYDGRTNAKIEGAAIEVIPWMTMHGHGSPKNAIVKEQGGGKYAVENVYFTMEGDWDLLINITKNGIKDTAIFTIKKVKN